MLQILISPRCINKNLSDSRFSDFIHKSMVLFVLVLVGLWEINFHSFTSSMYSRQSYRPVQSNARYQRSVGLERCG